MNKTNIVMIIIMSSQGKKGTFIAILSKKDFPKIFFAWKT